MEQMPYQQWQITDVVTHARKQHNTVMVFTPDAMAAADRRDFRTADVILEDVEDAVQKMRLFLKTAREMQESNERVKLANMAAGDYQGGLA